MGGKIPKHDLEYFKSKASTLDLNHLPQKDKDELKVILDKLKDKTPEFPQKDKDALTKQVIDLLTGEDHIITPAETGPFPPYYLQPNYHYMYDKLKKEFDMLKNSINNVDEWGRGRNPL